MHSLESLTVKKQFGIDIDLAQMLKTIDSNSSRVIPQKVECRKPHIGSVRTALQFIIGLNGTHPIPESIVGQI